jgi:hypothetical protein
MFAEIAKLPVHEVFGRQKRVADVGIELEVEGGGLPSNNVPHWQCKAEGSLQNGIEYITKPIKADMVETYVDNLRKYITDVHGGVIVPSYRCSTHVHVNVGPISLSDALGFAVVFTMFEPVVLGLCGNQRDGNLFCMSSYDTGEVIQSFDQMLSYLARIKTHGYGFERGKYSALNFGRLADLNTMEVRCFPLSMEGKVVSKWVSWLLAMRDLAVSEPDKTYRELWKKVRQNPHWYLLQIFGGEAANLPNGIHLVDYGTETAYELTKVLKKHYNAPAKKAEGLRFKKSPASYHEDGAEF